MSGNIRSTKGSKGQRSVSSEGTSNNPQTSFQGPMTARHASLLQTAQRQPEVPPSSRQFIEAAGLPLFLQRLAITGYKGKMFACWSGYYTSSTLVNVELVDCVNCISLPPLGQLPSLRELRIERLDGVVSIGSEFYYGDSNATTCVNKPFRCLRSLKILNMWGWKEWCFVGGDDNEGGVFPNLVELVLSYCPYLTGRLALDNFPMLKEVELIGTNVSLVPRSPDSKLVSLYKLRLHSSTCLKIVFFPDGGLHAPNLTTLEIGNCRNLSSWPEQMHSLLPSLVSLTVKYCPELQCNPKGGFPSELESLAIMRCKRLNAESMQNLNNALQRLTFLQRLTIDYECDQKVDWFLFRLLPSTLIYLHIYHLNSETINGAKWFDPLTSLQELEIENCRALQFLPESGLPSSLSRLKIYGCPLLEKRCQRETGEDWSKIAHIPFIQISLQKI